jgi:hypothetical protein
MNNRIEFTPCDYYRKKHGFLTEKIYLGFFVGIGYEGNLNDGIDTFHIIKLDTGHLIHVYDPKTIKFI